MFNLTKKARKMIISRLERLQSFDVLEINDTRLRCALRSELEKLHMRLMDYGFYVPTDQTLDVLLRWKEQEITG